MGGTWGADNYGHFRIDRTDLLAGSGGGDISLPRGQVVSNYSAKHVFSIALQLKVGWHTLEVVVANEGDETDQAINPAALNISGLEIRLNQHKPSLPVAIDPVALVLQGKWYDMWVNLHHPNDPAFVAISHVLEEMSPADRQAVLTRATQLATFATEVKKAASAKV